MYVRSSGEEILNQMCSDFAFSQTVDQLFRDMLVSYLVEREAGEKKLQEKGMSAQNKGNFEQLPFHDNRTISICI